MTTQRYLYNGPLKPIEPITDEEWEQRKQARVRAMDLETLRYWSGMYCGERERAELVRREQELKGERNADGKTDR